MKRLLIGITALVLLTAGQAQAVDLRDATNRQILDELAHRLNTEGGGNSGGASVWYSCDRYSDVRIAIVGSEGQEVTATVSVRSNDRCIEQIAMLSAAPSTINDVRVIGICDTYGDLNRFALTRGGAANRLSTISVRNYTRCLEQARDLNDRA